MKKIMMVMALVLVLAAAGSAQILPTFEFNLYGGYGLKNINAPGDYYYGWSGSYYYLAEFGNSSYFNTESSGGLTFGGGASFYFHPNIGVGLDFRYFRTAVTTTTDSDMWWAWWWSSTFHAYPDILSDPLSMTGTDNYFQSMPLSLNFIFRYGTDAFEAYASAGPTLFLNKVFLQSEIAYALEYNEAWAYQAVDVILVPTEINESWTAFGGNFGAGFSFNVSPSIGLFVDARYFLCGSKLFDWTFYTGYYEGLMATLNYAFDSYDVDYLYSDNQITSIEIKPSSFQFVAGIKIRTF